MASLYNDPEELRLAVQSLKPFLSSLGFVPSRVIPSLQLQPGCKGLLAPECLQKILPVERKGNIAAATSLFFDAILKDNAPSGALTHFMQALLKANQDESNLVTGPWFVHDVITLACAFMPLQIMLLRLLGQEDAEAQRNLDVRSLADELRQVGQITPEHLTRVHETLEVEGQPQAAIRLLVCLYVESLRDVANGIYLQGKEAQPGGPPEWVPRLVEMLERRVGPEVRQQISDEVLSSNSWQSKLDQLSFRRNPWRTDTTGCGEGHKPTPQACSTPSTEEGRNELSNSLIEKNQATSLSSNQNTPLRQKEQCENMEGLDDDTCMKVASNSMQSMNNSDLDSLTLKTNIRDAIDEDLTKATPYRNIVDSLAQGTTCKTLDNENSINGGDLQKVMPAKNISLPNSEASDNSNVEVDMDVDVPEEIGEPIELRDYQQELAEQALAGINVIVCAPTGSGKTHVALKIMKNHLEQHNEGLRKVVFLTGQVALADQQYMQCLKYLKPFRCKHISGSSGANEKVPLKEILLRADVLVMTAQILLDALDKKEVKSICQFSLLVFDECHHTNASHPFNCIMHHYMAAKHPADNADEDSAVACRLPQVIGLTASVGVGKAKDNDQAMKHIRKLCAHLDADWLCTVRHCIAQLNQHSNSPEYELQTCPKRREDKFHKKIVEMMKTIEEKMGNSSYTARNEPTGIKAKLKAPHEHGTNQYTVWVTQLRRPVAMLEDAEARRFLESSRRMLEFYNSSLEINDDCESLDALNYLVQQFEILNRSISNAIDIDIFLKDLFDKNKPYLDTVCREPCNENPKLNTLKIMLLKAFLKEPESRAMIFVKTRDLATALHQWMLRDTGLKILRPEKMVGAGPSCDRGGMTKNQQVDVMKYFREGDHKVLIATSVAEEGLDISKCNLVIRYDHVTNEIAMVQARGRARAENSQFVTLASQGKGVQEKDEINLIREMMMHEAIRYMQEEMLNSPTRYAEQKQQIQNDEKRTRDIQLAYQRGRQLQHGEVILRCRNCDEFACLSSDIMTIEKTHHVIKDMEFRDRCEEKPHPKPAQCGPDFVKHGKLHCKKCGLDWGIVIVYSSTKFRVIKIESFIVIDQYGKRDAPKKWKKTTFPVQEMTHEDLERYRKEALEVGYVVGEQSRGDKNLEKYKAN